MSLFAFVQKQRDVADVRSIAACKGLLSASLGRGALKRSSVAGLALRQSPLP
jgi:hypothetical protein